MLFSNQYSLRKTKKKNKRKKNKAKQKARNLSLISRSERFSEREVHRSPQSGPRRTLSIFLFVLQHRSGRLSRESTGDSTPTRAPRCRSRRRRTPDNNGSRSSSRKAALTVVVVTVAVVEADARIVLNADDVT